MADEGYCMKCREKRQFEGQVVTLKNGRPAAQGTCPVCGTKLTKILGMDAAKASGWAPARRVPSIETRQQLLGCDHGRTRA